MGEGTCHPIYGSCIVHIYLSTSPDQSTTTAKPQGYPPVGPTCQRISICICFFRFNDFFFNLVCFVLRAQVITCLSSLPARES